ncbi:MAG: TatD family hydrolase [Lyngbya sp.]|nr:TatD family hydrolase [Lyngbya sp.]
MQLVDTHVHLNFDVLSSDLEAIQQRWKASGVVRLVHSCVHPGEFTEIQAIADRVENLFFSVGLHPLDTEKWTNATGEQILKQAQSDPRVVALGEMGLDFYKADNYQQQMQVLEAQLELAYHLNKPVIIHCRDAAEPLVQLLRNFEKRVGKIRGVMHCWGGTPEETQMFLDLGFYISFSGTVTFKKATQIQESARLVDSKHLLIETDCPFLAPVPRRGKRNEPAYVRYVAEKVAQLRDIPVEILAQQTTENACRLFGLPIPQVEEQQPMSVNSI